jgi:predicted unusual protein kinase regulating ubiquinone biosynthesis (AarF/ABC1/UbiB family)
LSARKPRATCCCCRTACRRSLSRHPREIDASFGAARRSCSQFDPRPVGAASIAQVHRAVTTDGRDVAVKVLRPGIREKFARDIETYEWAAAHLEALGGEAARLRPRLVIANFKRWTLRELDLRREAASASELAEAMRRTEGYRVPGIDWDRTNGRVMTIDWIDGIKISETDALRDAGTICRRWPIAAGADLPASGDQQRILPRRHAPGQSVRAGRRHDRRD